MLHCASRKDHTLTEPGFHECARRAPRIVEAPAGQDLGRERHFVSAAESIVTTWEPQSSRLCPRSPGGQGTEREKASIQRGRRDVVSGLADTRLRLEIEEHLSLGICSPQHERSDQHHTRHQRPGQPPTREEARQSAPAPCIGDCHDYVYTISYSSLGAYGLGTRSTRGSPVRMFRHHKDGQYPIRC